MHANNVMNTNLNTVSSAQPLSDALHKMQKARVHMLPVVDGEMHVLGIISTQSIMRHIVPDYILSGDLEHISFAPDLSILFDKFNLALNRPISELMDTDPLIIHDHDSLLSIAAALHTHEKQVYALVVSAENKLLGVVSDTDILNRFQILASGEANA